MSIKDTLARYRRRPKVPVASPTEKACTAPRRDDGSDSIVDACIDDLDLGNKDTDQSVKEFVEALTPDDRVLFEATTKAIQLLDAIKEAEKIHKANSKGRYAGEAIKPFVDGVEHYGKAWDVLSNANSMICPIWGSARIVLKARQLPDWHFVFAADILYRLRPDLGDILKNSLPCSPLLEACLSTLNDIEVSIPITS